MLVWSRLTRVKARTSGWVSAMEIMRAPRRTPLADGAGGGGEEVEEGDGPGARDGGVAGRGPVRSKGGDVEAAAAAALVGLGHLVAGPEDAVDGVRRRREHVAVGQGHVAGVAGPHHDASPGIIR